MSSEAMKSNAGIGIESRLQLHEAMLSATTSVARDASMAQQNPNPIVMMLLIVITLVDPLKALFVPPSPSFWPRFRPTARPDGQPPLAFILDTATFIGAAGPARPCVPGKCLQLAMLWVRSGEPFPWGAITALALAKMVITPILGVALTRLFARAGFVDQEDKVLQFVCMLEARFFGSFVLLYSHLTDRHPQPVLVSSVGYDPG
ncbi:hypothetical protein BC827DRAFT_1266386 [Russula dissimulans]|nr:hypothetical protein BC827DRAFT_1266386 [Russula dissimulans]